MSTINEIDSRAYTIKEVASISDTIDIMNAGRAFDLMSAGMSWLKYTPKNERYLLFKPLSSTSIPIGLFFKQQQQQQIKNLFHNMILLVFWTSLASFNNRTE